MNHFQSIKLATAFGTAVFARYIGKDGHGRAGTDRRTRTDGHADTKDGQLWKRRALKKKTGTYGKDGHLWKRRALMEKTGIKFLKARFLVERLTPRTTSITHIVNKIQNTILTGI